MEKRVKEPKKELHKKQKIEEPKSKTKKINGFVIFILVIILCDIIASGILTPMIKNKIDKLGGGASGVLAFIMGHNEDTLKNLGKINILLIGESGEENYKLSDTMMICSYEPKIPASESKMSILSIPRDTYVGSYTSTISASYKINARYAGGKKIDTLLSDLEKVTGIKLDYYIRIDTKGLVKLVNLIGGVQFDVPMDMKYDDPTQNLHINLQKGNQLITGEKAEQLLRFRHSNNGNTYPAEYGTEDFGRMKTQRAFIEATLKQTLKASNFDKINKFIEVGYENIVTNIELEKILDYVPYMVDFKTENLKQDVLPGVAEQRDGVWIYTYDKKKSKELIEDMFFSDDVEETKETN